MMLQDHLSPADYTIVRYITRLKTLPELSVDTGLDLDELVKRLVKLQAGGVIRSYGKSSATYPSVGLMDRGRQLVRNYEKQQLTILASN